MGPDLGLTNYNLDAEMQGWGKGGSWEQGCQALFLMKRKWLKMAEIFAKTTENDKNWRKWQRWQRNSAKMTEKDRKWRTFLRFPRHIGTSGARHFTFSSALLKCLLPTVQLTFSRNSFHWRYNYIWFSVLPPDSINSQWAQRQLLCGDSISFIFRDLTAA